LSPKVLKFDGPSKDGRRHRRGTYLFELISHLLNLKVIFSSGVWSC
jgi:hypothetical protein